MKSNIIVKKLNPKPLELEIKEYIVPISEKATLQLSEETVQIIRDNIKNSILRKDSTGHLASSFFAEKINNGYGVGNINYLNQNAKQWYWLEHGVAQTGRTIPPMTIGHFNGTPSEPSKSATPNQRWVHESSTDGYLMIPKKPIEAKNYIAKTIAKIPELINRILNTVK